MQTDNPNYSMVLSWELNPINILFDSQQVLSNWWKNDPALLSLYSVFSILSIKRRNGLLYLLLWIVLYFPLLLDQF